MTSFRDLPPVVRVPVMADIAGVYQNQIDKYLYRLISVIFISAFSDYIEAVVVCQLTHTDDVDPCGSVGLMPWRSHSKTGPNHL